MRNLDYESKHLDAYYHLSKINIFHPDQIEKLNAAIDDDFYFEKSDYGILPVIRRDKDDVEITLRGFSIRQLEIILDESRKLLETSDAE